MPCSTEDLFSFLDRLGIAHQTTSHPPIFNAEQGRGWHDKIPGRHCKNLFLKDGKGSLWLVVMPADKRADLAGIAKRSGAARFSFAEPELLTEALQITPGSVTPFALLNDSERRVKVVLDEEMLRCEKVNYHPLHNAASTTVSAADFLKFIQALGYDPVITECGRQAEGNV
jgi:Ala-tRNA(Pro) deacylase